MGRRRFFDEHAGDWDATRPPDLAQRLERVLDALRLAPGQAVLDVGTGTGVLLPAILRQVGAAGSIVALDISPQMLAAARSKGFPANVRFIETSMEQPDMLADESFDRVVCNATFPHFANPRRALAHMVRVLRPAGLLVISHVIGRQAVNALHRAQGGPVGRDRVPRAAQMRRLLEGAGLVEVTVTDEPDFYLACGRKPMAAEQN